MKTLFSLIAGLVVAGFVSVLVASSSWAESAAGTYMQWFWPGDGYTEREWRLTPLTDSSPSAYFYAHQQGFVNGDGFYVGLQTANSGKKKWMLFSVWQALGAQVDGGKGWCQTFEGEGEGYSCRAEYNWIAGRPYILKVYQVSSDWWRAQITDTVTGRVTALGRINVPQDWGGLGDWSVSWTEHFIDREPQCADLPYSRVRWGVPISTGATGTVRPSSWSSSITQSSCAFNSRITENTNGSYIDEEGIANQRPTPDTWSMCAYQNQVCDFPTETRKVRYGAGNTWVTRTATGRIDCNNVTFGDPLPGTPKTCWHRAP